MPTLWQMPAEARYGDLGWKGDNFLEKSPPSEESKPPGPWPNFLEFPRSFFLSKNQ